MLVRDVLEMAKVGTLSSLAVSKNESAMIKFIQLGVSELYRRFNMSIKVETIITNPNLALYELKNEDVSLILGVYNNRGQELTQTDVLGGRYDYKIINYKSFLLRHPKDDLIFAIYKASAPKLKNLDDVIELPDSMMDALLTYVAYIGHSTINKDKIDEASAYSVRFDKACTELEAQGYRIPLSTESKSLVLKGYV